MNAVNYNSLNDILSQISELFPDPDNVTEITDLLNSAEKGFFLFLPPNTHYS